MQTADIYLCAQPAQSMFSLYENPQVPTRLLHRSSTALLLKWKCAGFPGIFKQQPLKPCACYHFVRSIKLTPIRQHRHRELNSTILGKKKYTDLMEVVKPESLVLKNYCCIITQGREKQVLSFCSRPWWCTSKPWSLLRTERNHIHFCVSWKGWGFWQGLVLLRFPLMWCFPWLYFRQYLFRHWLTMAREQSCCWPVLLYTEEKYCLPRSFLSSFLVLLLMPTLPNYPASNVPGS